MHMYTFDSRNAYTNMWVHKFYSRNVECTYICMCSLTREKERERDVQTNVRGVRESEGERVGERERM